ncbi:MAG: sulfotransferase family 2 domain-containing protein [Verrucomicrobiota bacterium JB023]|nr:sulfotransferase family 2 domain-containing protein [Verrucomicrobiota bacterium JB023]
MIAKVASKIARLSTSALLPYPYQDHVLKGLIYIHIPKCGGNSIIDAIGHHRTHHIHAEYYHYVRANKRRFRRCHKFTVVRNPVDRAHSLYNYMKKGGNGTEHDRTIMENFFKGSESFEEFLMERLTPEWLASWVLLRPQAAFIYDQADTLMVDSVLRLESINEDFSRMLEETGKNARPLPHLNTSGSQREEIKVTPEAMERLLSYYRRDFTLLYPDFDPASRVKAS